MASRPIWSGVVSFGLLNIPVSLMSGEKKVDLHFRMLDCRNNEPVRYERVNAKTGEEVPWNNVCKAYEYNKGSFVVLEKGDLATAAPKGSDETVEIEAFVDAAEINPMHFERPYVLVPGKKADKGYVILRDTLAKSGKVGIARVVIRTREYLCALMPRGPALIILLMRYAQELVDLDDFALPTGKSSTYRVTPREMEMARSLIDSMSVKWNPSSYHDEFRKRMQSVIDKRVKKKGGRVVKREDDQAVLPENAATNVVDFMALLKNSLASNRRSPAKKATAAAKPAKKAARKAPAKKVAKRKTG